MLLAFRIVALGIGPTLKGEIMSSNYVAQREALVDLSVAYEGARDFTRQVLCTALGSVPPPSECVWPPDITQAEADSRLRAVRHFLAQTEAVFKKVLRDIEVALDRLVASGFDVPRSWIITGPLYSIRGWYLGACGVEEIVRNAASEDSALQMAVEDIAKDVKVYLKCKIAKADDPAGFGGSSTQARQDDEADGAIVLPPEVFRYRQDDFLPIAQTEFLGIPVGVPHNPTAILNTYFGSEDWMEVCQLPYRDHRNGGELTGFPDDKLKLQTVLDYLASAPSYFISEADTNNGE